LNIASSGPTSVHFHIVWSGAGVHFARFGSREEADELAQRLATRDEAYAIEAFDDPCEICAELLGNPGERSRR
jgi:hypothetical protein